MNSDIIQLDRGWDALKAGGIDKIEYYLDTGNVPGLASAPQPGKPVRIFGPEEYSKLYTMVYDMCTQKQPFNWSEKLYIRYGETLAYYLQQRVAPALEGKTGLDLLIELRKRWVNHKLYVKWMDRFFQYLDRYYVRIRSAEPMHQRGLSIFKTLLFDRISGESTRALLQLINSEREGFEVPEDVLKTVIEMYIELGVKGLVVYQTEFEQHLLPSTSTFYAQQSHHWLAENTDLSEYLVRAEKALLEEDDRVARYLHPSTLSKLRGVVIAQLLSEPLKQLLAKPTGVIHLLSENKLSDLARVYRMFALVDGGLVPVATAFRQFVTQKGTALVDEREQVLRSMSRADALNDPVFVQSLMDLQDQYKQIVAQCFQADTAFQKSLKEAFEVFVNREFEEVKISIAALMSSFCDRLLRKSGERMSHDEIETGISKLVDLFSFLSDKDDFSEIYRNQLSKRLLSESSSSHDSEKSLIQKLKMKCGANFTSKLEGMITDLALANDMQREFRNSPEFRKLSETTIADFSVTVLTTGFWPTYTAAEATMPVQMSQNLEMFKEFYAKRTQHRKLQWIHSLGTATVVARFGPEDRKFDLVMNTYQALILLLFNGDAVTLTSADISAALGIEEGFVKKLLATLVLSKFKVLERSACEDPNAKTIESTDRICVNEHFNMPQRRVRIPPPLAGTDETHNKSKIEEDRSFSIEAAIVRVMKTRKVLAHSLLVAEVVAQLNLFKPNPKAIKQRIENLIEREFLERDPDNINLYKYLA